MRKWSIHLEGKRGTVGFTTDGKEKRHTTSALISQRLGEKLKRRKKRRTPPRQRK